MIRTRGSYKEEQDCIFWHLDKSYAEIEGINSSKPEKRFIVALKGSGTVFQDINEETRGNFLKVAEEAPYYYGHGLEGCSGDDEILKLFSAGKIIEGKEGYGSVHFAGKQGTIHAAPKMSSSRLILLITSHEHELSAQIPMKNTNLQK